MWAWGEIRATNNDPQICLCGLFRFDGSCRKCEQRCPAKALAADPFGRHACYDRLLENARLHERHGLADVCGKCAAVVPCSFADPVKRAPRRNRSNR